MTKIYCRCCEDIQECRFDYPVGKEIGNVILKMGEAPEKSDPDIGVQLEEDEIIYYRRWRKCTVCGYEFSTAEVAEVGVSSPEMIGKYLSLFKMIWLTSKQDSSLTMQEHLEKVKALIEAVQFIGDAIFECNKDEDKNK